jgi:hypothetical protein
MDAVLLALDHALAAKRDYEAKLADVGAALRAARGTPGFGARLLAVRDSGVMPATTLAEQLGVSRGRLYELLERAERERGDQDREGT